ncbi:MAG TPA: hypothetical protein VHT73_17115 [Thermodesulfobacteriota bacterium]|nr:hypothetical protein [Thermodesulfobacteriota bacterium]
MGLEADEMKKALIEVYNRKKTFSSGKEKNRFFITKEDFKRIAGKSFLREVFLEDVVKLLREDGYILIDLREDEKDGFAIVSIDYLMQTCERLSDEIVKEYEQGRPDEDDEVYEAGVKEQGVGERELEKTTDH